ncbi:MAG: helix-turn-helix domain-containing protein [Acidobacteriota bacterium]|nr:helix-turn-helix domain-containing protein [Acidobacteriota bacterium]
MSKRVSDEERKKLIENHQNHPNFRVRHRSHAILLSHQGSTREEIARICRVQRDTVSLWINAWQECGCKGLEDNKRSGRPPILTVEEQAKAIEIALRNPKFPHRQLSEISQEMGKEISRLTLKDLLKKRLHLEENQVGVVEENG